MADVGETPVSTDAKNALAAYGMLT
jgi:hypothetical protein